MLKKRILALVVMVMCSRAALADEVVSSTTASRASRDADHLVVRLVDEAGRPVNGADVGTYLLDDPAEGAVWRMGDESERCRSPYRSDSEGIVRLPAAFPHDSHLYALTPDRRLVGIARIPEKASPKTSVTMTLYPACRVRAKFTSAGLAELGEPLEIPVETGRRQVVATITASDPNFSAGRKTFFCEQRCRQPFLECLLPPGQYDLHAEDPLQPLEIRPGQRELNLGTIDVKPTQWEQSGRFSREYFYGNASVTLPPMADTKVQAFCFSIDGTQFATAGNKVNTRPKDRVVARPATINIWRSATGERLQSFKLDEFAYHASDLEFSRDRSRILVATGSRQIGVFECKTNRVALTPKLHTKPVSNIAFDRTGRYFASGSRAEIILWDSTKLAMRVLPGASEETLRFSCDGRRLVSLSSGVISLWDTGSGGLVRQLDRSLFASGLTPLRAVIEQDVC